MNNSKNKPQTTLKRCHWCQGDALYQQYHDEEWGVPTTDDRALFELLNLEGMQAGLSWLTILRKRKHMVAVFHEFDPVRLAASGERELKLWLQDAGVIRHRGKLAAILSNARAYQEMNNAFSEFIWGFVGGISQQNNFRSKAQVPSATETSTQMSKELKKRGFKFVGPTICYAFMQSAGLVNDHIRNCFRYQPCLELSLELGQKMAEKR